MKNNKEIIRRNKKKLHGRNVRREVGYIENANFRGKKIYYMSQILACLLPWQEDPCALI